MSYTARTMAAFDPRAPRESVLVVDDQPANLLILTRALEGMDLEVVAVRDGPSALAALEQRPFDLILLDAMMPGVSGFEVAEQVRARNHELLPIVMVTSLDAVEDLERAFAAGVNDFLRWPVNVVEVRARVRSFLHLRRQERELASALRAAETLSDLQEDLVALLVHDLKGPLATIRVLTGMIRDDVASSIPRAAEDLTSIDQVCSRMSELILDLIDISRMEQAQLALDKRQTDLGELLRETVRGAAARALQRGVSCQSSGAGFASADRKLLSRVVQNLVDNAIAHTPRSGSVTVTASSDASGCARIAVTNTGSRLPLEARKRIFEKYASVQADSTNRGLGLYFCRLAMEAHGGTIVAQGPEEGPITFEVSLAG